MEEVIIIGAGPAGISASIYLARQNILPTIIYSGYGALEKAEKIENYYAVNTMSGIELFEKGIEQAKNFGSTIIKGEILSIGFDGNYIVKYKSLEGKNSQNIELKTKSLIIATGKSRKSPNIAGLKDFEGRGVSYCAVCDAFFYRQKDVAVIGEGDYALEEALVLSQTSKNVHILTDGQTPSFNKKLAENSNIKIIEESIEKISGDLKLEKIIFKNGNSLDLDGLFIAIGTAGGSDFAKHIGIVLDEKNNIKTDDNMATNVPGIYAAGDITGTLAQVANAVSSGMISGLNAAKYIRSLNKN